VKSVGPTSISQDNLQQLHNWNQMKKFGVAGAQEWN
jgi:hypothetical protein